MSEKRVGPRVFGRRQSGSSQTPTGVVVKGELVPPSSFFPPLSPSSFRFFFFPLPPVPSPEGPAEPGVPVPPPADLPVVGGGVGTMPLPLRPVTGPPGVGVPAFDAAPRVEPPPTLAPEPPRRARSTTDVTASEGGAVDDWRLSVGRTASAERRAVNEGWMLTFVVAGAAVDTAGSAAESAAVVVGTVACRVRTTWLSPRGSKLASFASRSRSVFIEACKASTAVV